MEKLTHVDLAYIDGNHRKKPTLDYFYSILPYLENHSVIAIGDIHWSAGMEDAWSTIKSHPSVYVTVDLFYLGLVFFRKELSREHFIIKFP
jgi:predicted O-methyltransferase YrrM